jgi:tetratricopeptide (TPR) repeat protein
LQFKDEDALYYINLALDMDDMHASNWNRKAIILEGMKRYAESEKCYNKSLELSPTDLVRDNKTRMLYDWAAQLIEESKKLPNGLRKLELAKEKNLKAINARPGENSEEDLEKYLKQRDTINYYIDLEREYQRNLETLKSFDKSELFTITGIQFYKNNINLTPGMPLKLVKEPDNEHDKDAIAAYVEDEKIGYVANNENTKYELTSSASELQDKIQNTAEGHYLFYLQRYTDIQFHIGRIN